MFQMETRGFSLALSISTIRLGGKSLTQEFYSCRATAGAKGQNGLTLGLKRARGGRSYHRARCFGSQGHTGTNSSITITKLGGKRMGEVTSHTLNVFIKKKKNNTHTHTHKEPEQFYDDNAGEGTWHQHHLVEVGLTGMFRKASVPATCSGGSPPDFKSPRASHCAHSNSNAVPGPAEPRRN